MAILHFGCVTQMMAFGGPDCKRLLGQIAGIGLRARQAERELIQRRMKTLHQGFKFHVLGHTDSSWVRGSSVTIVPGNDGAVLAARCHGFPKPSREWACFIDRIILRGGYFGLAPASATSSGNVRSNNLSPRIQGRPGNQRLRWL